VGVRVGVASVTNLRCVQSYGKLKWSLKWVWQTFFLNQSIGIDEINAFQLKSQFPIFDRFRDNLVHIYKFFIFLAGLWAFK